MREAIAEFYQDYLLRKNAVDTEEQELLSSATKKGWTQHLVRKSSLIRESHSVVEKGINEIILPHVFGQRETSDEEAEALKEGAMSYFRKSLFDEVMESSVLAMLAGRYAKTGNRFEERRCRFAFANNAFISAGGEFSGKSLNEANQVLRDIKKLREIRKEHETEESFLEDVSFMLETGLRLFDLELRALEPNLNRLIALFNAIAVIGTYQDLFPKDFLEGKIVATLNRLGLQILFMQALHWDKVREPNKQALREVFEREFSAELTLPENERHPRFFMIYVLYCFYDGKLSADECFNLLSPFAADLPANTDFSVPGWYDFSRDDRFFAVCFLTRPVLQMILGTRLSSEQKKQRVAGILYDIKSYIETIPRECAARENMDYCLYHLLYDVVEFIDDESMAMEFIDTLMMNRQLATLIHSIMTAKLTQAIIDPLADKMPQLFYEVLSVNSDEEVRAKKEDLALFLYNAAKCHDIGKIRIATIINTQIRSISDAEFSLIRMHSVWSADILSRNKKLSAYKDIALGHHKSYDGKSGYPEDFDNHDSKYRILTEILTICDSMDAATDAFGRNYQRGKTFEKVFAEFESLKGTRYNPVIIDFIRDTPELFAQLKEITSKEARGDFYYHIYRKYR